MPTPVSYLSGASLSNTVGMIKRGTIAQNLKTSLESGYRWWNGVEVTSSQYLIYSDTFTLGTTTQANATPVAYSTPDLTDQSLLNLINTLPPRIGQTAFTSLPIALQWLQSSNKFFLIRGETENIVKSGLQLYLDAGRYDSYIGSGTTWSDLSSNGNNGTLVNGTGYNSSGVGSMVFDGTNDYISFNNISPVSNLTFTISSVVTVDTDTVQYMRLVSKGHYGFTPGYIIQRFGDSNLATGIKFSVGIGSSTSNASTALFAYTTDTFQKGQKYYLTMVSTGSYLYLYVNGVRTGLTKYTGTGGSIENGTDLNYSAISGSLSITTSDKFTIGAYSNSSNPVGEYWNGKILNTIIYNSALSPEQVLQNYNTQKLRFGYYDSVQDGLIFNLDAGNYLSYPRSGTTWTDLTGKGNNGTLINGPTFSGGTTPSIVFDGSDDYVRIFGSANYNWGNQITVNSWFYNRGSNSYRGIINNGYYYSCSFEQRLGRENNGTDMNMIVRKDLSTVGYLNMRVLRDSWNMSTLTYDGTSVNGYVNGELKATTPLTGSIYTAPRDIVIGMRGIDNFGEFFDGNISNTQIYNRALSPQEVIQNFESQRVNYGITGITTNGLVLNLDAANTASYNGSGTTWVDISSSRTDGVLTNGPSYISSGTSSSISFDGSDDYVILGNPESLRFNNTLTYGCWFYWTNTNTLGILMGKRNGSTAGFNQFGLTIAETMCCGPAGKNIGACLIADDGTGGCVLSAALPNYVGWVYGVIAINTTEQKLYINGVLSATSNVNFTNKTFNVPGRSFYVGAVGGETEGTIIIPFNNKIANAQVYNRTLSDSEVLNNYNAIKSRFGL